MITLYVMCGIPGSGKTTLAKKLERTAKRHSYDDIPNARGNSDKDGKILQEFYNGMKKDLLDGFDVVCDDTNLTRFHRMRLLNEFRGMDFKKIAIIVDTPVEECIRRNEKRQGVERINENQIRTASGMMETPSYIEGWDEIYRHEVG